MPTPAVSNNLITLNAADAVTQVTDIMLQSPHGIISARDPGKFKNFEERLCYMATAHVARIFTQHAENLTDKKQMFTQVSEAAHCVPCPHRPPAPKLTAQLDPEIYRRELVTLAQSYNVLPASSPAI